MTMIFNKPVLNYAILCCAISLVKCLFNEYSFFSLRFRMNLPIAMEVQCYSLKRTGARGGGGGGGEEEGEEEEEEEANE